MTASSCARAARPSAFPQSAWVTPAPVVSVVTVGGEAAVRPVLPPATSKVTAVVKIDRKKLQVTQRRGRWYHNRGRHELQTLTIVQLTKFKRHSWHDRESMEDHVKTGRLDDPEMQGKPSASRFMKIVRPPDRSEEQPSAAGDPVDDSIGISGGPHV
jgi:hypothetical protein